MNKKIIYVAGKYRSDKGENGIYENIQAAREAAIRLWQQGWIVICPHMNSAFMGGAVPDEVFLEGDLEIIRRCDAIYMLLNYTTSDGAKQELKLARELGKEIFYESINFLCSPFSEVT